ncbi:MAG: hypothetical protein E5Y63_19360 [Mesorhizobium sp.]|uniref:hypothetical protein n=1 Tax=Mesorhizobium sp. TaxID=1871066 RepID=UPI000FE504E7|nr:hypothetical protein [Mesorhizobium sp.]RWP61172.1 MAG: hypothetical protein EOR08_18945 [Mesorhizobium sp.]TIM28609.1 MAG: hypothetical protein E5Y63_19360 [Mesorhizobium sp.]
MPTATVQTIYCVQPATGTDFGVNQAVLDAIMSLTPQFSQNDFASSLLQGIASLPSVLAAIDAARADPDNLYITTDTEGDVDNAVWPSPGNTKEVNAKQSFEPGLVLPFEYSQNLSLWDSDISGEDLLGSVTMTADEQGTGEIAKIARSDIEGSAYYVIYRVD